jgi:hypothetical protein
MIGVYPFNNDAEKGTIDVDYFHYETNKKMTTELFKAY